MLPHIYRVNHRVAFYKRADEPFIEAPNLYDDKQSLLENQNSRLEPIRQVEPIFPSTLVDIVDGVEQEREQEEFIELQGVLDLRR